MSKGAASSSCSAATTSAATTSSLSSPANGSDCKKWDLTPYELERQPQEVITDHDVRMALHPECLRNDFMCPICLKLQSNSVTVMGCLHRFCRECIIKALSNTSKECPVCRTRLPNKRYLRPDPNFDMLISRIFPLREEDSEDMNEHNGPGSKIRTRQNTRRLRTMRFARDASPDSSSPEKSSDGSPNVSNGLISEKSLAPIQDELEVILRPLSEVMSDSENWLNQTRYIKVPAIATVDHLIKYLNIRFKQESLLDGSADGLEPDESLFTLCFASGPGQFQPVLNGQLLKDIKDSFFKGDRPLELHYAYNITTSCGITETDDKRMIPDGFDIRI